MTNEIVLTDEMIERAVLREIERRMAEDEPEAPEPVTYENLETGQCVTQYVTDLGRLVIERSYHPRPALPMASARNADRLMREFADFTDHLGRQFGPF